MGLRFDLPPTGKLAQTEDGEWVLRTGLGAFGLGTMWQRAHEGEDLAGVPVDPDARDGFGRTSHDERSGAPWGAV